MARDDFVALGCGRLLIERRPKARHRRPGAQKIKRPSFSDRFHRPYGPTLCLAFHAMSARSRQYLSTGGS
jgi:hypothetical protein